MMVSPVQALLRSRKFLLLILDTIISVILFFVGKFSTPEITESINFLIVTLQPVFVTIIGAIAYEDAHATIR